jgi:hypothetical protein
MGTSREYKRLLLQFSAATAAFIKVRPMDAVKKFVVLAAPTDRGNQYWPKFL